MGGAFKLRWWSNYSHKPGTSIRSTNSLSDTIGSTQGYLSSDCRRQFLQRCWDFQFTDSEWAKAEGRFHSYFSSYEEFCQVERPHVLTTCSHDELCKAVRELTTDTREDVETKLLKTLLPPLSVPRDDKLVIPFIGKAILGMDLSNWKNEENLHDYIGRTMGMASTQIDRDRLSPIFNAATFTEKAGIRILWQRDLGSHLDIAFGDTTLKMFHDVAMLDLLEFGVFKSVFPQHFIQETRRTIDLMLPMSEPRCRRWLKHESQSTKLGVSAQGRAFQGVVDRNLQTFDFWRDRLIVAKDVFDTSQPKGLMQLIRDDRNKVQYWTFWIAFIVFWLTLGGFITGCLQTYKAYHPSPQPPWPGSEG